MLKIDRERERERETKREREGGTKIRCMVYVLYSMQAANSYLRIIDALNSAQAAANSALDKATAAYKVYPRGLN